MKEYFSFNSNILSKIQLSPITFLISLGLIILSYLYLIRKLIIDKYKKRKFKNLFNLDESLEKEMNNFRKQQTKLIFHFIHLFQGNPSYKGIYLTSQKKFFSYKWKRTNY